MRRASENQRQLASVQLRRWAKSGALGLDGEASKAVRRAAFRLGFPSVEEASYAGCSADLFSEAIEDVESLE